MQAFQRFQNEMTYRRFIKQGVASGSQSQKKWLKIKTVLFTFLIQSNCKQGIYNSVSPKIAAMI